MDRRSTKDKRLRVLRDVFGKDYHKPASSDSSTRPCGVTQSEDYVISESSTEKASRDLEELLADLKESLADPEMRKSLGRRLHPQGVFQSEDYVISGSRRKALTDIMEALTDPNIYMMGVCGKDDKQTASLLKSVQRRAMRDSLFGVTVTVSIKKNPNLTRIQQEIADQLGLSFEGHKTAFSGCVLSDSKSKIVSGNARQLSERILREPNILFILCDLHERLDLEKLGIPFGVAHKGCKLILTSESEEVLSNQMNTQPTFTL